MYKTNIQRLWQECIHMITYVKVNKKRSLRENVQMSSREEKRVQCMFFFNSHE